MNQKKKKKNTFRKKSQILRCHNLKIYQIMWAPFPQNVLILPLIIIVFIFFTFFFFFFVNYIYIAVALLLTSSKVSLLSSCTSHATQISSIHTIVFHQKKAAFIAHFVRIAPHIASPRSLAHFFTRRNIFLVCVHILLVVSQLQAS